MSRSNDALQRGPSSSAITISDWRDVAAATIDRCYDVERKYWRETLGWDSTWTWAVVEQVRRSRSLPGFVARDAGGAIRGWTFHVLDGDALRIGGLVADGARTTRQLFELTTNVARVSGAKAVACFITSRADGLGDLFRSRGGLVEPFHYLAAPVGPMSAQRSNDTAIEQWDGILDAAADLLAAAYAPGTALHFAGEGTVDDWRRYMRQLVEQHGCGTIDPSATVMVRDRGGLAAVALVTSLAPETAHVAQIAVRADRRGEGLARRMLGAAAGAAHAAGRSTMTLLVGDGNHSARRLYDQLGFAQRTEFIAARVSVGSAA